jgi:gamma-glutamylputrescine oxidase
VYPNSYYAATASLLPVQPSLGAQSIRADVCVVGAGYTGLSTAMHLAKCGASVVILESPTHRLGASGRNGGQLYGGQRKTSTGSKRASGSWRPDDSGSR